jgi:hypothetical protein
MLLYKPAVKNLSNDIFPAMFSYFNFHALFNFGSYWGRTSEQSFFLHTWSLSVEEQFYLIYPLFLFAAHKYFKSYFVPIFTITALSSVLFFSQLYFSDNLDIAFYMFPTRIWELGIGGLIGFVNIEKIKYAYANYLSILGILLVCSSYFFADAQINYWVLLPVIGSALIILFSSSANLVGKLLSINFVVLIGKLSYSLYLWHWVIIVLFKNLQFQLLDFNAHAINVAIFVLTIILSFLSFKFIEDTTRNYKHTPKIVIIGILLITSLTLFIQSDSFDPTYESKFNQAPYYGKYYDISPAQSGIYNWLKDNGLDRNLTAPDRPQQFDDAYKKAGILSNNTTNDLPEIMLVGDSHGVMWAKLIDEISGELNSSLSCYTANGTRPFFNLDDINAQVASKHFSKDQRIEYATSLLENINEWNPKLLVLVCRWESISDLDKRQLNDLLAVLNEKNIRVLLLTQPPCLYFMVNKSADQFLVYLGLTPVEGYNSVRANRLEGIRRGNDYVSSLAEKYPNITVFDVYKKFIEKDKVRVSLNKDILFFDEDHLSYPGTAIHKEQLLQVMDALTQSN